MKVLFTGATGVIGREAVPLLVAAGHDVDAVVRNKLDRQWAIRTGATPVSIDLFDPADVAKAMVGVNAVIHMATSIPAQRDMPKRKAWRMNDRLRSEATGLLVDAALAENVGLFIQQSITYVYSDGGSHLLNEASPVRPIWDVLDSAIAAERHIERFTAAGSRGIVLRFSSIYGPGRASAEMTKSMAERKLPIIGSGDNYVSSLHVVDAATAVAAALDAPAGVYNVSDDVPMTRSGLMAVAAAAIGAPAPRTVPGWLAKALVGQASALLTVSQRVSNASFRNATGWRPHFNSVVTGWSDTAAGERKAG